MNRRTFLGKAGLIGTGLAAWQPFPSVLGANQKIRLAIMGTNGRGTSLARSFARLEDAEVAFICDPDQRAIAKAVKASADIQGKEPEGLEDFRTILDRSDWDALVIAAPNHWHAPATILGCQAGKHVYVEKPASQNAWEGQLAVEAARKYDRIVQVGMQRRSLDAFQQGIQMIHDGAIGKVHFARAWYANSRGGIGKGEPADIPDWLDYELWQGPAPEHPFQSNLIHYNWHWFWHWGNGELGNNGIHSLDVCRWGLQVDCPTSVTSTGGRYHFDDDQQTPDTNIVAFDFGHATITWEGRSCQNHPIEGTTFGVAFYGTEGTMIMDSGSFKIMDPKNQLVSEVKGDGSDTQHLQNFLDCIRSGERPTGDIEIGHKSTMLCHLGNIAYRTGHTLHLNPDTGKILDDPAAEALLRKEYRPGWTPKV
ncbi:MAG: Gfo/Idh/MocA family protein [Verrucomicrobiota bacterium]|jgi:predicted dehydrogenase